MKKPQKENYGWNENTGWLEGDKPRFEDDLAIWQSKPQGAKRTRPIHESWDKVIGLFDHHSPTRSRAAFCRWAKLNQTAFSGLQVKQLSTELEAWILAWVESWDKPKIDLPIWCSLCEKELTTKDEVFFSREMLCINSSFYLLEEPECKECHELNQNGDFGIMPQFRSEYNRLMEKD